MTVVCSAGPRCRLQLLRVPVRETGDAAKRYQVRVLDDTTWVTLHASKTYGPALEVFSIEAYWRCWRPTV